MENKILAALSREHMLQNGDKVIVALSGGADSVALFHFFVRHAPSLNVQLAAAHCNHGLRGAESDGDQAFVTALCAAHGVPLFVEGFAMAEKQKPKGESVETWARRLRYSFFEGLALDQRARIATAHTSNDNAETVLFHALRGTGPRGLAGIPPVRSPFIRPMLDVSRFEVESYCTVHNLRWCADSTNADLSFTRNRLRREALPLLEEVHTGAGASLSRLAADMRSLSELLEGIARPMLRKEVGVDGSGGFSAALADLAAAPPPVRLYALSLMASGQADRRTLARMEALVTAGAGAVQMSGGRETRVVKDRLFVQNVLLTSSFEGYRLPFSPGEYTLPGGYMLNIQVRPVCSWPSSFEKIAKKSLTFSADYDKISECDAIRTRQPGDRFAPRLRGVTKTLKKWMNESAISTADRQKMPLLAAQSRVLWVWGEGFCEGTQPCVNTQQLLVVEAMKFEEGAEDGSSV